MESANKVTTLIRWNNAGGELDSVTVKHRVDDDYAVTNALIKMIRGNIVAPGDTFVVTEI